MILWRNDPRGVGGGVTFYISEYGDVREVKVYFSALPLTEKVCFSI